MEREKKKKINTKSEILEILEMPYTEFDSTIRKTAKDIHVEHNGDTAIIMALLGYDNVCKNHCTYCGMSASYQGLQRYRMNLEGIKKSEESVRNLGVDRIFLISGEDPQYDFKDIVAFVEHGKKLGMFVSLAAGELSKDRYLALEAAGLDEYVLKFETSDRDMFAKIKPSTTFENRMGCIDFIKGTKMKLASGNIVGMPNQTLEQIAEDIVLMKELEISWAPIIPYMPVPNTPMAKEGGRGSLETIIKEISILRLMMPSLNITAQQPGEDVKNGLADFQGNLNALASGANVLFIDMLPQSLVKDFNVISNRMIEGMQNVNRLMVASKMKISSLKYR